MKKMLVIFAILAISLSANGQLFNYGEAKIGDTQEDIQDKINFCNKQLNKLEKQKLNKVYRAKAQIYKSKGITPAMALAKAEDVDSVLNAEYGTKMQVVQNSIDLLTAKLAENNKSLTVSGSSAMALYAYNSTTAGATTISALTTAGTGIAHNMTRGEIVVRITNRVGLPVITGVLSANGSLEFPVVPGVSYTATFQKKNASISFTGKYSPGDTYSYKGETYNLGFWVSSSW